MKTTPVTAAEIARSVVAAPPLARGGQQQLDRHANVVIGNDLETASVGAAKALYAYEQSVFCEAG